MVPFLLCLQIVAQAEPQKEVTIVDLLVVYTPAVRTAAGGSAAIQDQIRTAVTEANLVFLNSQVDARVRLVHSAEVQYTESGSVSNDLYRLRIPNDGLLDEVHQLRDQF